MAKVRITLKKSLIGKTIKQKENAKGLGLKKINSMSILEYNSCTIGMIKKVNHLIEVSSI